MRNLLSRLKQRSGQGFVEYALILVVILGVYLIFNGQINAFVGAVFAALNAALAGAGL